MKRLSREWYVEKYGEVEGLAKFDLFRYNGKTPEEREAQRLKNKQWRREYQQKRLSDPKYQIQMMLYRATARAKETGVPFAITIDDITIPSHCPILGIPLEVSRGHKGAANATSPSLDKIIPEAGYVKGNIQIISQRANMIKSNATADELIAIGTYLKATLQNG